MDCQITKNDKGEIVIKINDNVSRMKEVIANIIEKVKLDLAQQER